MKKKTKKIVRGRAPIQYRVKLAFSLSDEENGTAFGLNTEIPIRKGAGERMAKKYSPKDVAQVLREVADAVEKGDFGSILQYIDPSGAMQADPRFHAARAAGRGWAERAAGRKAN